MHTAGAGSSHRREGASRKRVPRWLGMVCKGGDEPKREKRRRVAAGAGREVTGGRGEGSGRRREFRRNGASLKFMVLPNQLPPPPRLRCAPSLAFDDPASKGRGCRSDVRWMPPEVGGAREGERESSVRCPLAPALTLAREMPSRGATVGAGLGQNGYRETDTGWGGEVHQRGAPAASTHARPGQRWPHHERHRSAWRRRVGRLGDGGRVTAAAASGPRGLCPSDMPSNRSFIACRARLVTDETASTWYTYATHELPGCPPQGLKDKHEASTVPGAAHLLGTSRDGYRLLAVSLQVFRYACRTNTVPFTALLGQSQEHATHPKLAVSSPSPGQTQG